MLRIRKDYENLKNYGFYNTSEKIYELDCKSTLDNVDVSILVGIRKSRKQHQRLRQE